MSYDEEANQNGYITCGYATWVKSFETELTSNGCYESGGPDFKCNLFENDENGDFGSSRGTIAKYDLGGKMVWCRAPNSGHLNAVKQVIDKSGYIAVGRTFNTLQGGLAGVYGAPLLNNPTAINQGFNFAANCIDGESPESKLNVVRLDNDGDLIWNYTYDIVDANNDFLALPIGLSKILILNLITWEISLYPILH